jgi:hypothetical protein
MLSFMVDAVVEGCWLWTSSNAWEEYYWRLSMAMRALYGEVGSKVLGMM